MLCSTAALYRSRRVTVCASHWTTVSSYCTSHVSYSRRHRKVPVPFFNRSVLSAFRYCFITVLSPFRLPFRLPFRYHAEFNNYCNYFRSLYAYYYCTLRAALVESILEKWSLRTTQSSVFCGTITVVYGLHRSSVFYSSSLDGAYAFVHRCDIY